MDDPEEPNRPSEDTARSATLVVVPSSRQHSRPPADGGGLVPAMPSARQATPERTVLQTTVATIHHALTFSPINVLLIFVPAGIATAQIDGIHGGIVFGLNCAAVIPLAGLLAHATETVACDMGDALGALMNVTFGNSVELIIFM